MKDKSESSLQASLSQVSNFFLDNNIFWVLAGDRTGKKIENWNQGLKDYGICTSPRSLNHAASAFSLLESVKGQNKLPSPGKELLASEIVDVEEYKAFVFEKAKAHFSSLSWLQDKDLRIASQKLKENLPGFGRSFYELVIEQDLLKEGFARHLWESLAYDFVINLRSPPQINHEAWDASFYIDLVKGPAQGHNISFAKAAVRHFHRMREDLDLARGRKKKFLDNIRLKSTKDHLDGVLITFAVGGLLHAGQLEPVLCFTADENIRRIKDRLFAQRALLEASYLHATEMSSGKKLPFVPLKPQPGHVFICDYQGNFREHIDVSTVSSLR